MNDGFSESDAWNANVEQVVEALSAASGEVSEASLLSSRIANDKGLDRDAARPFVFAFGFMLHRSPDEVEDPKDFPFGPSMTGSTDDGEPFRFPPSFSEMDQPALEAWRFAYDLDPHPMVKGRLGDLLWEAKSGDRPDQYARGAIDALLKTASDAQRHSILRSFDLDRALQLSLLIRDPSVSEPIVDTMLQFLEETEGVPDSPGPPMTILRALVPLNTELRPENLEERLDRALETYAGHVDVEQEILDLTAELKTGDDLTAVRLKQLDLLLKASESAESGILKVVWLHRALEHATIFTIRPGRSARSLTRSRRKISSSRRSVLTSVQTRSARGSSPTLLPKLDQLRELSRLLLMLRTRWGPKRTSKI